MECVSVMGKCRACCIKTQKEFQIPIFTGENLQQIFREVTSLEIHENDKFPGILCEECHSRLLDAYKFRQMCSSSALAFQEILSEDDDNDFEGFEEKYKPSELVDVSECTEVPSLTNPTGPDEKFSFLVEPQVNLGGEKNLKLLNRKKAPIKAIKSSTRKKKCSKDDEDPLDPLEDDPDWTTNATKKSKVRKEKKPQVKSSKVPREKKSVPPKDTKPAKEVKVKDEPEDAVLRKKTTRGMKAEYICSLCGLKHMKKVSLKAHMRTFHQGLKAAQCNICHKEFTRTDTLRGHMVRMHDAKDMFRCKECGKVFRTQEGLMKHTKEWHDPENPKEKPKNFMCDLCGKAFPSPAGLRKHTNSHAGIRPFKCTVCSRRYPTKHHFKIHMMRHEGIKQHVCTVCGLQKTTMTELKTHMNLHTQERIFSCEQCPKTFLSIGNFSRHVKIVHQGIKAYNCPHCERSFGKKETLKHHVMTHTGEKPHGCEKCGKRFIQPTALQTHMKTHEKFK